MRRFVSVLLVVLIACCFPMSTAFGLEDNVAYGTSSGVILKGDTLSANGEHAKLHFYIDSNEKYYNIADKETCIEAFEYMKELHSRIVLDNDLICITIEFDNDFTKTDEFRNKSAEVRAAKDRGTERTARQHLNDASKRYHREWAEENMLLLREVDAQCVEANTYAPYIQLEMEIDKIDISQFFELSKQDRVLSISFSFKTAPTRSTGWDTVLTEIGASDIVDAGIYTGEDVRIGVLEVGGVCDTENANLKGKSITLETSDYPISDHATKVTSIIASIAPDADIYVYGFNGGFDLGWFIEMQCSIVNCSFSVIGNTKNADGTYNDGPKTYRTDIDGLFDYVSRVYGITFVVAAGNKITVNTEPTYNPDAKVTSPGLAYNAITVGGVKRTWSWFSYKLEHDDGACYVSSVPYVKPEISAFFTVNIPNIGVDSGTSLAAPQVTACIAILLDHYSAHFDKSPAKIKAILMANATETSDYTADVAKFDDRIGAGCINLSSIIGSWDQTETYTVPSGSTANTQIGSTSVGLSEGDVLQVALAWNMYYFPGATEGYITNYDIRIYNSSGTLVSNSAIYAFSNVEMLRYTVPADDTYRIVVYQVGNMDSNIPGESVYMAYNIA